GAVRCPAPLIVAGLARCRPQPAPTTARRLRRPRRAGTAPPRAARCARRHLRRGRPQRVLRDVVLRDASNRRHSPGRWRRSDRSRVRPPVRQSDGSGARPRLHLRHVLCQPPSPTERNTTMTIINDATSDVALTEADVPALPGRTLTRTELKAWVTEIATRPELW